MERSTVGDDSGEPGSGRAEHLRPVIAIADDDAAMRELLVESLQARGFETVACASGAELLAIVQQRAASSSEPDVAAVVADVRMPGVDGFDVVWSLHQADLWIPVVLITAFPDQDTCDQAFHLRAEALLAKPFDLDELARVVADVAEAGAP